MTKYKKITLSFLISSFKMGIKSIVFVGFFLFSIWLSW